MAEGRLVNLAAVKWNAHGPHVTGCTCAYGAVANMRIAKPRAHKPPWVLVQGCDCIQTAGRALI